MLETLAPCHARSSLSHRRSHLASSLLLGCVFIFKSVAGFPAPQVWIGAMEPEWRHARGWPENDFLDLFKESAPWSKAASKTSVFMLTKKFAIEAPDSELKLVIDGLKARNIALALQGVPLVATDVCGRSVESYGPPHHMAAAAERIKKLGGTIQYIALDEPLFFGHVFPGNPSLRACHSPIDKIAEQTVFSMNEVRKSFPGIKVGDTEPFPVDNAGGQRWIQDLAEWVSAYRRANGGAPFAFFLADLVRITPAWQAQFRAVLPILYEGRIPLGVIYNGEPSDNADEQWTRSATSLCNTVERQMNVHPNIVVFQTWMDRPRRMMPDTDAGSLTSLIANYHDGCH